MFFTTNRRLRPARLAMGVFAAGLMSSVQALAAEDTLSGLFVRSDGWVLTTSRGLSECGDIRAQGHGRAVEIVDDQSHGLRLVRFDVSGVPAVGLNRSPRLGQTVTMIRSKTSGRGLEVEQVDLSALTAKSGDASVLRARYERNARNAAHFALDQRGRLIGVLSRWSDQGATAELSAAGYVQMLLNAHAGKGVKNVKATRVQDALVTLKCRGETVSEEPPAFDTTTLERFGAKAWAEAFAEVYQTVWSSDNAVALDFVRDVYAPRVDYFGKSFSKAEVMRDKRNFARRWDLRSYAFRKGNLDIQCRRKVCQVKGVNDFFTYSTSLGRASSGVAEFSFDLDLESLTITRENSSVLSRGNANPKGMFRAWATAQKNCNAGDDAGCGQAAYLKQVLRAFGHCITPRRPSGRIAEVGSCR